jgi:methionyl-tRNA formyltransferase
MLQGGDTVVRTVDAIVKGEAVAVAQETMFADEKELVPAPKIFRDTCRINWEKDVEDIYNFVRGMSPYPAAWCELTDANNNVTALKVYEVKKEFAEHSKPIGTLLTDGKSFLKVAVKNGYISLTNVQLSGKKRMPVADLLNGFSTCGLNMNL